MKNSITIIADASFCSNTGASGYGVWIAGSKGKGSFEGPLKQPRDNNVAETMAIANALWHGFQKGLITAKSDILIQTDSQSAIDLLKGLRLPSCQQYRDALVYIQTLVSRYRLTLRYNHVRGHTNGQDNRTRAQRYCDLAAKRQMIIQRAEILNQPVEQKPVRVTKGSTNYLRSRRRLKNGQTV